MSFQAIPTPSRIATRGGLSVYGPGTDGNVTVVSSTTLTRDMYYNNLTILAGAQIDTNGYRIFVKGSLHMADPTSLIGRLSNTTSLGTLLGGALPGVKASDTLGGDGGLNPGENFFGEAEFYNFSQAIAGYKINSVDSTIKFLMGGSGGLTGPSGSAPSTASVQYSGSAGGPGGAGSPGAYTASADVVGASGGMGSPGNAGSTGNVGIGGTQGAAGLGGVGGAGGGVVIVSARNITGYGVIRADGKGGSPASSGGPGNPGTPGNPGSPGNPGAPAPGLYQAAYTYITEYAYNYYVGVFTPAYTFYNVVQSYPATPTTGYNVFFSPSVFTPSSGGNQQRTSANEMGLVEGRENTSNEVRFVQLRLNNPAEIRNNVEARVNLNEARVVEGRVNLNEARANPSNQIRINSFSRFPSGRFGGNEIRANASNQIRLGPPSEIRTRESRLGPPSEIRVTEGRVNPATEQREVEGRDNAQTEVRFVEGRLNPPAEIRVNPFTPSSFTAEYTNFASYTFVAYPLVETFPESFEPSTFNNNLEFSAQQNANQPEAFHPGGAGGAAGAGGVGGVAEGGVPGSPGVAGYAGGGGVVLVITEADPPIEIDIRASAGSGGSNGASSGTVIIIKNEGIQ